MLLLAMIYLLLYFCPQVGVVPALAGLFETLRSSFPQRPMQLAMTRWALRRYVKTSFTKTAKASLLRSYTPPMEGPTGLYRSYKSIQIVHYDSSIHIYKL